ncbi:MAG: dihydroneopterin aldolase [Actinobacteria bacterium]|nr:dihydroneopterin aldolase [Actinomycetota bacterium]
MDIIRLKNMVFYGYHGVHESENQIGGKFAVDLELYRPLRRAGRTDNLDDTLNYQSIYETVATFTQTHKYFLIEALAESIAREIIKNYLVEKLIIRVRKPNAPVQGVLDEVEVELTRTRADYA